MQPSPPAHASARPSEKTLRRLPRVGLGTVFQFGPPVWRRMVPAAPTAQSRLGGPPTASSVLPVGSGFSQHQESGVQLGACGANPHMFATPPAPHARPAGQPPQSRVCPQPSSSAPQVASTDSQLFGVQPQAFATPPPPQVF